MLRFRDFIINEEKRRIYKVKAHLPSDYISHQSLDPVWNKSWARNLVQNSIKIRGKRYEQIAKHFLAYKGYDVRPRVHSSHDMIVNRKTTELKGASSPNGKFSFMQIRPKQGYQQLVFMSVHPDKVEFHKFSHKDVQRYISKGIFKPQHGGRGKSRALKDTYMYGGTLEQFPSHKMFEIHSSEFS